MKKTIGIMAHVDAGKTTFSEGILYHTKSIKNKGRVDHKNSFMDDDPIERERGITVFSGYASFDYEGDSYYLVDTPGHTDFSAEMERSVMIMDYAVVVISAVEGIQGHTETLWQILKKHKIPTFFFINKIDRVGADSQKVFSEIRNCFSSNAVDITDLNEEKMPEEVIEFIAEQDENLLDKYFNGEFSRTDWDEKFINLIKGFEVFPVAVGSALEDVGVLGMFKNIHRYTRSSYHSKGELKGRVFRIRHREDGTKITYIKAYDGTLKTRDIVRYGRGEEQFENKITGLFIENGGELSQVEEVCGGDVFGVKGLLDSKCGDWLGEKRKEWKFHMIPLLKSKVVALDETNLKELYRIISMVGEEDPALSVNWVEDSEEIQISVMGKIQLEILKDMIDRRFNIKVDFMNPQIIYKETIEKEVHGFGHFEPLGHYAEVHLKMEPSARGSGIVFENRCHTDYLSTGHMNLVKHHIFEREHRGVLTGSGITDIKITLMDGRSHKKHTSGGDFREATFRALRQGMEKVENILLEPYYRFKMSMHIDHMGKVLSHIQKANGSFEPPENQGDKIQVEGFVPVSTFMDYPQEFQAVTGGRGTLSLSFGGYRECHNREQVIEEKEYSRKVDKVYTSTSIFCSKGQSYLVPWDKAEDEMHCIN